MGGGPEVTAEQVCRALNQQCEAVFRRRRVVAGSRHTSNVIFYQKRKMQAAKSHKKNRLKCII
ncbi:MAG: hypothetical protein C0467_25100 [Planctomycetaceae bacterium]|nr:hypothetical protein [Planctomycetaceae bacterium]